MPDDESRANRSSNTAGHEAASRKDQTSRERTSHGAPNRVEPPQLNPYAGAVGQEADVQSAESDKPGINPFAPATHTGLPASGVARVDLPPVFWVASGIAGLLFLGLLAFQPFFGIVGLMALVAAVVRVPLLQRTRTRTYPQVELAHPVALLATSWVFTVACGLASCIAFCAICLPAGIVASNQRNLDDVLIPIIFGVSGLIGLAAFGFLFRISLRLPV